MKKQTSEIEELWNSFPKLKYSTISGYDKGLIIDFIADEKKKWKEEVMDSIEGEFGIAHTSNAPMLSDGSGKYENIVFMPLKEWKQLRVKLNKEEGV